MNFLVCRPGGISELDVVEVAVAMAVAVAREEEEERKKKRKGRKDHLGISGHVEQGLPTSYSSLSNLPQLPEWGGLAHNCPARRITAPRAPRRAAVGPTHPGCEPLSVFLVRS